MPTIRISEDHYQRLRAMAVKATAERDKIISIGQIAGEHLEKTLPKEGKECETVEMKKK